ncbi:hypothetical protein F2P81_006879 [Scophthalmus maximus]|uniref:Uncharacterized protein n=1 Tax=Scophthalmus maximus TaxID=52904 RepID=A0A6A4TDP3_SCOMX|nr:hypothetical protein F2P81_006879 [Scophthalmus maximus]
MVLSTATKIPAQRKSTGEPYVWSLFPGIRLRCVFGAQHHSAISSAEGPTVETLPEELSQRTAATHVCNDTLTAVQLAPADRRSIRFGGEKEKTPTQLLAFLSFFLSFSLSSVNAVKMWT